MTIPARLARAALSGATFFAVYWAMYAVWDGPDNVRLEWAVVGAMIVAGLTFARINMIERLKRRHATTLSLTLRDTVETINTIVRKPDP